MQNTTCNLVSTCLRMFLTVKRVNTVSRRTTTFKLSFYHIPGHSSAPCTGWGCSDTRHRSRTRSLSSIPPPLQDPPRSPSAATTRFPQVSARASPLFQKISLLRALPSTLMVGTCHVQHEALAPYKAQRRASSRQRGSLGPGGLLVVGFFFNKKEKKLI